MKNIDELIQKQRAAFTKSESEYRTQLHRFANALETAITHLKSNFNLFGGMEFVGI